MSVSDAWLLTITEGSHVAIGSLEMVHIHISSSKRCPCSFNQVFAFSAFGDLALTMFQKRGV